MMKQKTATILGSTGLIGGKLLELLLSDNILQCDQTGCSATC